MSFFPDPKNVNILSSDATLDVNVVGGGGGNVTIEDINIPSQTTTLNVTANAGTNLNTSLLAVESGGNIEGINNKIIQNQQNMENSISVCLASNQTNLPVSISSLTLTDVNTGGAQTDDLNVNVTNSSLAVTNSDITSLNNKVEDNSYFNYSGANNSNRISFIDTSEVDRLFESGNGAASNNCLRVCVASDNSTINVAEQNTSKNAGLTDANTLRVVNATNDVNLSAINGSVASLDTKQPTLGQKAKNGSIPVTLASDEDTVNTRITYPLYAVGGVATFVGESVGICGRDQNDDAQALRTDTDGKLNIVSSTLASETGNLATVATNTTNINNCIGTNLSTPNPTHAIQIGAYNSSSGFFFELQCDSGGNIKTSEEGKVQIMGVDLDGSTRRTFRVTDRNLMGVCVYPNSKIFKTELLENSGVYNAAVDYSVTAGTFLYLNTTTTEFQYVHSLNFNIVDSGKLEVYNKFASLNQLTNGIQILYDSDGTTYDLTANRNIKDFSDLLLYFDDYSQSPDLKVATFKWKFSEPLILSKNSFVSDQIRVIINDDLSGLDGFYMKVDISTTSEI